MKYFLPIKNVKVGDFVLHPNSSEQRKTFEVVKNSEFDIPLKNLFTTILQIKGMTAIHMNSEDFIRFESKRILSWGSAGVVEIPIQKWKEFSLTFITKNGMVNYPKGWVHQINDDFSIVVHCCNGYSTHHLSDLIYIGTKLSSFQAKNMFDLAPQVTITL